MSMASRRWPSLEAHMGALPPTRMAESPSGSRHYYWVQPPGWIIRNDVGRKLGPGIDVRGEGGMVIAPPSRRGGGVYKWLNDLPFADAPRWLLELIVERPRPTRKVVERDVGKVFRPYVELLLQHTDPDLPYPDWFSIGCACYDALGDEVGEQVWDSWSANGSKYKAREIASKWRGIVARDGYNHTLGTIEQFADLEAVDAKLFAAMRARERQRHGRVR